MTAKTHFWMSGPPVDPDLAPLLHLRVVSLGHQVIPPGEYRWTRAQHRRLGKDFQIFQYGCAGHGTLKVGRDGMAVEPGHGFVVGDGEDFEYGIRGERPWEIKWVRFEGPGARAASDEIRKLGRIFPIPPNGDAISDLDRLLANCRGGSGRAEDLSRDLVSFLISVRRTQSPPGDPKRDFAERVTRRIRAELGTIDLAGLAGDLNVGPDHFTRVFESTLGTTPHQYILGLRLEAAARDLEGTALKVREIAARVGYFDPSYFGKAFRKRYGFTPEAWRARHRGA